jgi:hypothetical protein
MSIQETSPIRRTRQLTNVSIRRRDETTGHAREIDRQVAKTPQVRDHGENNLKPEFNVLTLPHC